MSLFAGESTDWVRGVEGSVGRASGRALAGGQAARSGGAGRPARGLVGKRAERTSAVCLMSGLAPMGGGSR